jgi:hypothetical protein
MMFAALLYKEYREHRAIWLALALVGAGLVFGVPLLYEPDARVRQSFLEMLGISALVVAWTYGVVCGAMLLAGEREGGTQEFLDMLPTSRLPLWLAKCVIGVLFVYLQVVLLGVLGLVQGIYPQGHAVAGALALLAAGMVGYVWGMLFSALARNVLNAIGLAILFQVVILPLCAVGGYFVLAILAFLLNFSSVGEIVAFGVTGVLMLAAPLPLSALIYTGIDRRRHRMRTSLIHDVSRWWSGSSAVRWLAWRQLRGVYLGLLIFSLLAAVPVIGKGLLTWPVLTLGLGAFCGVAVFLDEQSGAYRFLGEQRFPLGTIWRVKVGRLFLAVLGCVLVMLFMALMVYLFSGPHHARLLFSPENRDAFPEHTFLVRTFGTLLMRDTIPPGLFLFLWPIYGFAIGSVCGLLFRKPLVAMVAAFGLGALLAGAWAPSLMLGGLHLWQVAGVPIVLLFCSRLLMHVWASDCLRSWTTVGYVAVTAVLCAVLTALGLWYRVVEIPDTREPKDFPSFVASLPTPEENEAGRLIRGGLGRLADVRRTWGHQPQPGAGPGNAAPKNVLDQFQDVLLHGWPDANDELGDWLDNAFKEDWWKRLAEAAQKRTGVVEDPRDLKVHSPVRTLDSAPLAAMLLAARGLQMQKMKGDPAVFVGDLATTLALVRNLQNHAPRLSAAVARHIEAQQLEALTRWLEQLEGEPALLARVAKELREHSEWLPADYHEQYLAEYLIALNSLDQPEDWPEWRTHGSGIGGAEPFLLQLCWRLPYERERQGRVIRALHWGDPEARRCVPRESRTTVPLSHGGPILEIGHPRRVVRLGAAQLMVALRRFQAETGRPAERLEELVPKYLASIPEDPFRGQPFRYRLSKGEEIIWPRPDEVLAGGAAGAHVPGGPGAFPPLRELTRTVAPGQGILWSVGEDKQDGDAKRQGLGNGVETARKGEDLIFLVPLPPNKRAAKD